MCPLEGSVGLHLHLPSWTSADLLLGSPPGRLWPFFSHLTFRRLWGVVAFLVFRGRVAEPLPPPTAALTSGLLPLATLLLQGSALLSGRSGAPSHWSLRGALSFPATRNQPRLSSGSGWGLKFAYILEFHSP